MHFIFEGGKYGFLFYILKKILTSNIDRSINSFTRCSVIDRRFDNIKKIVFSEFFSKLKKSVRRFCLTSFHIETIPQHSKGTPTIFYIITNVLLRFDLKHRLINIELNYLLETLCYYMGRR